MKSIASMMSIRRGSGERGGIRKTARDEARLDSDIDQFIDHPVSTINLFVMINLQETTSHILGHKVERCMVVFMAWTGE